MLKKIILVVAVFAILGGSYGLYLYFMPHRDVQSTEVFTTISSGDLVAEYLKDNAAANTKYLADDGDSKVIIVTGKVFSKEKDQKNQWVIILKDDNQPVGVSCTFMLNTNKNAENLQKGQSVKIKGVLRSGVDEDSEMLGEDVIIENCDVFK
ncbi:MAG: OB-fold putative lipoprotein [Bacteroidales bacterium]|nr:OB-fold putative lipoprotein [Bacteroidales bacterium]